MPPGLSSVIQCSRRRFNGIAAASLMSGLWRSAPREDGEVFLRDQARRVIESARLSADAPNNRTGHDLHVPGGNMGYPAFWIRDAAMMLGADFIGAAELSGWIRLICSTIPEPVDYNVREGVVVPAWSVPDHITFEGKACFYPGSYETGDRQGGAPWGKYPPLDDAFYFLQMIVRHWRLTGSTTPAGPTLTTSARERPLAEICDHVYDAVPCDAETKLVVAGDVDTENAKDWGFCDSILKSGKLLFPSLLKLDAARGLSELFGAAGDPDRAARYRQDAETLAAAIKPAFLTSAAEADEGWLHSATGVGNQPDVWGSAFAVHSGAISGDDAARISHALGRAYRERTAVRGGFVRHLLTTDPTNAGGWERSVSPLGEYQNGGYWGTPVGWYISALHKTDEDLARALARDYLTTLRGHLRPDGTAEAWEWVNEERARTANSLYVATVALPYLALQDAGLLGLLRPL
ncbi:MAG: hypothetical protein IPJ41_17250 [Phycisphaerales bacterium]|nr:hypothetical protein [Phycisphaerales bacterium]